MTTSMPVDLTFRDLVISYLRRRGEIPWLDWLPLAQVASETPERWVAAFNQLSLEDQFDLVGFLRMPQAGPLAGALLLVLAHHADEIKDEQVRQFILEDAVEMRAHQASALQVIRTQLATQVAAAQERLQPAFDLADEIIRLEKELADIRRQEHDQDERFAQVHQLELEILRLETRRRILADYNEDERIRYREELRAEVDAMHQRKKEIEESIGRLIEQRAKVLAEVQTWQQRLQVTQKELQAALSNLNQLQQQVQEAQARINAASAEQRNLINQQQEIAAKIEKLDEDNRLRKSSLEDEKKKLKELEMAAQRSGLVELEQKVREVYAMLPDDLGDQSL
ncbi:MAG: hypothetical protein KatS3mg045_1381 [Bellilinea sp.]|nr:MAG: hypothetical protein KatS3mg045_1381 [Bellilinea sp.]